MVTAKGKDNDALPNYEDLEELELVSDPDDDPGKLLKSTGHGGVHSTSFKDMCLKPTLQQAIVDCGFEHPSDV